jgi:hypothetical protein
LLWLHMCTRLRHSHQVQQLTKLILSRFQNSTSLVESILLFLFLMRLLSLFVHNRYFTSLVESILLFLFLMRLLSLFVHNNKTSQDCPDTLELTALCDVYGPNRCYLEVYWTAIHTRRGLLYGRRVSRTGRLHGPLPRVFSHTSCIWD